MEFESQHCMLQAQDALWAYDRSADALIEKAVSKQMDMQRQLQLTLEVSLQLWRLPNVCNIRFASDYSGQVTIQRSHPSRPFCRLQAQWEMQRNLEQHQHYLSMLQQKAVTQPQSGPALVACSVAPLPVLEPKDARCSDSSPCACLLCSAVASLTSTSELSACDGAGICSDADISCCRAAAPN